MNLKKLLGTENDFWRGVVWASIVFIVFRTIFPSADSYLAVEHGLGVVPYGQLWTWLNPMWWTQQPYAVYLFIIWAAVTALEYKFATRGLFDVRLVYIQVFATCIMYSLHAYQNVTVIMFFPFAAVCPWVTLLLLFQKIPIWVPFNWNDWNCAFNGTGNGIDGNPCLSNVTHLGLLHVYSISYIIVAFCFVLPLIVYVRDRKISPEARDAVDSDYGTTFVTCHCGQPMIEDSYEYPHGDVTGTQKCYACEYCGEIIDREEGCREDGWPDGISQPEVKQA